MQPHRSQDAFIWKDLSAYLISLGDGGLKCVVTGGGHRHADANRTPEVANLSAAKAVADNTQVPTKNEPKQDGLCPLRTVPGSSWRAVPGLVRLHSSSLACDLAEIYLKKVKT